MPHPLLIAARISPYRRAGSTAPVAVDDTGLSITSGQTRIVAILNNDLRAGDTPTVSIMGSPTGPVTASITAADQMQVIANSGIGSTTPFSVTYQLQTLSGFSQAVVSGVVEPAVAATATIVAQWDLSGNVEDSIGTIDGLIVNNVAFDQPSMLQGVSGSTGVAMNGLGHLRIDDPGASGALDVLNQAAFGISVYGQISANPSDTVARQLVNKDAGQPKCGFAIEYVLAGSPTRSRLNPYIRTDAGGTGTARRFADVGGITGLADLPVNTAFLVTFTFNPNTTPKCKCYLQLAGGSTVAFATTGLADENGITLGTLENFADLYLGVYFGGAGPMTGALQRLMFWAGAPTQAQHDALPNPQSITVTLPGAGAAPVAGDFTGRNIGATQNSFSLDPTQAPSTDAGAAVVSIVSVSSAVVTASVQTDGKTVVIIRGTGSGNYTVTYRLTVTGQPTDDGTIQGNVVTASDVVQIPASGGFTFVGKVGKNQASISKPPYPPTRPHVDPAFPGIDIMRISGAEGTAVPIVGGNWPNSLDIPILVDPAVEPR